MNAYDFLHGRDEPATHNKKQTPGSTPSAVDFLHSEPTPPLSPTTTAQSAASFLRSETTPTGVTSDAFNPLEVPPSIFDANPPALVDSGSLNSMNQTPPVSQETVRLLPDWMKNLFGQPEPILPTELPPARLPEAVLADLQRGGRDFSARELGMILDHIQAGNAKDPEAIKSLLAPLLTPEGRAAMAEQILIRQILDQRAKMETPDLVPGGAGVESFLEGFTKGATFNELPDIQPLLTGDPDTDKTLRLLAKVREIENTQQRGEHPISSLAGEITGSAIPFAAGVKLLRGLRVARGIAAVEPTAEGYILEGAKVGGPQAFAYRPEGSEKMTGKQELGARTVDAATGVGLGALFDAGSMRLSQFARQVFDERTHARLAKEAQLQGFDNVDEYIMNLVEFQQTGDGVIVTPNPQAIKALPGKSTDFPLTDKPDITEPALERPVETSEPIPSSPAQQTGRTSLAARAAEYERLAETTQDRGIAEDLKRQAQTLRAELEGQKPKLSPAERARRARIIDPETDDIVTAIRKLGGIDTNLESDWDGRLSHLPRKGFGLPGIERPGKGKTMDELAGRLWEEGYLTSHDSRELADKLGTAETGEDVFSLYKTYDQAPDEPRPKSTDRDWTYQDVENLDDIDTDFVIDTESGTVVPSRPLTEEDFRNIIEEEENAKRWFEKESESAADIEQGPADTPRLREGRKDSTQGARDNQPEYGTPDGPIDDGWTIQTPRGEIPYAGQPSPLRAGTEQVDLFMPPTTKAAERTTLFEDFGRRVKHFETGTFPTGLSTVKTSSDLAHVIAPIRRGAQESFVTVATDANGKVLRVAKLHKGTALSSSIDPATIAGTITNTPGASKAWIAHNHPSGKTKQSKQDIELTKHLANLFEGTGIDFQGSVVIGSGGRTHSKVDPDGTLHNDLLVTAAPRRETLPTTERQLVGRISEGIIESPEQVHDLFVKYAGDREGALLVDTNNRPVGFLPLSSNEMRELRGGAGGGSRKLLSAFDQTNADGFILRTDSKAAAGNMNAFAEHTGKRLIDVINKEGRQARDADGNIPTQSTFYANPFPVAIAETIKDIGLHPGRNVAAAFAGATAGATTSEHEIGTPGWWADIAQGAVVGIGISQLARATRLLGKGSILDNARLHLGQYIESLPLIGRGPADVREIKRKQRLMRQIIDRQTEEVGKHLAQVFSPSERAMMADLIESRGIVKDLNSIHRQAAVLDEQISFVAERMKELGMLQPELETGGYLHRYYAKHLGLDKMFRQAKAQSLSGSYTIARGTDDLVNESYLSPDARTLLDQTDKINQEIRGLERAPNGLLDADTQARIVELRTARRDLKKRELVEYVGEENGQVRSYFFTREEVPRVKAGLGLESRQGPALDARPHPVTPNFKGLSETGRTWSVSGRVKNKAVLHRDWTKDERKAWGEIEDAGYRYVRGMAEVSHDLSLATMFKEVADRPDWVSDVPRTTRRRKEWVKVPSSKVNKNSPLEKYGALAGKYVRPDVWNGIRNYGRAPFAPGRAGQLYRAALSKWKLYKTVYNPVTHLNNFYSNIEMLYMAGYSKLDFVKGLQHIRQNEKSEIWRKARDYGLFGTDWSTSILKPSEGGGNKVLDDLAEQLRTQPEIPDAELVTSLMMDFKEWWINSKNAVSEASGFRTGAELAKAMSAPVAKGLKFINRPVKYATESAQRLYRLEDDIFKMAVFQAEMARGKNPEQGIEAAQQFFFDYNDLPEAVKMIRDLPIGSPFISYTYLAIPAIVRNAIQHPEKVLALAAGYEAWNYAAMAINDEAGPGEYWAVTSNEDLVGPPWERGRALWGARNTIHMPFMEGYRLALGRSHALGNPFMTEAGGRDKIPTVPYLANFWGSSVFGSNPAHAVIDIAFNEDWKGKPIYKKGAPTEEKVKKSIAYLYQAWAPSNAAVPGGYHQTKIIEGLANDARKAKKEGRKPPITAPIVEAANDISEFLGFETFTGLNRMDNDIITRDAVLGSLGIKLRPYRPEQSEDFELSRLRSQKKETNQWFMDKMRRAAEGRYTDEQIDTFEQQREKRFKNIEGQEDKLIDAGSFLRNRKKP